MIEPKIITANQLPSTPNIYGIVLGESKSGKTLFASTFPNPFYITFKIEPRQGALQGLGEHIKIGYVESQPGMTEYEYMNEVYLKKGSWFFNQLNDKANPLGAKTIVLDSLTSLWKICAYDVKKGKFDDIYNSDTLVAELSSRMTFDERDEVNNKVLSVINRLVYFARAKNMHFIATGHLTVTDSDEGEVLRILVGSKNFANNKLLPFIDHVILIDADNTSKRWLHLNKTSRYPDLGCTTKPGHIAPSKIEDVTYNGFMTALGYGEKKADKEEKSLEK